MSHQLAPPRKTSFGHALPLTLLKGSSEPLLSLVLCPEHPFHQGGGGKLSEERSPVFSLLDPQPSNHFVLCRPLLLLSSIFPSVRVFFNELVLQVAKVLELQLQHQSFQ